ncbi:peptidyl-prolyl cis-trans isomerase, partial [uncultured Bilophila sp.]
RQIDPKKPAQREAYDALTSATLERMINNIILTQEAQRLKISVSDSEVDNEMQQIMSRNKITPEEFQRQLQLQRMSEKDFRERVRSGVLRNRLLANMVGRKVIVTKEEVADYYNIHKQNFVNNQRVRFALIVYPPTENAEKQSARLRGGKASFEEVARKVSIGPRAQEGGDVGMVSWNTLDPAWQERLSLMEPGEISDLFEVNNGLKAQLKLIDMESGEGQTLEEATPQIERILREPKLQERFREYTEQLRKRAVVEIRR